MDQNFKKYIGSLLKESGLCELKLEFPEMGALKREFLLVAY